MVNLKKLKLMPIILSGVLIVAGIVILGISYGKFSEAALAILFGTLTLGVGTTRLVYGFLTYKDELDARNNITLGVLDVVWGILMLVLNQNTFAFVTLFGLWCLIAAVLETIEILNNVVAKRPMLHLLADAIINLLFGVIMMIGGTFKGQFPTFIGIYLVLNSLSSFMVTLLSIRGVYNPEKAVEEITGKETVKKDADVELIGVEVEKAPETKAETAEPEVELVGVKVEKAPAKKTTTKKTPTTKTTTAKKPAAKTTVKKTTTKKTTTKKA